MQSSSTQRNSGFTLIELMVAITVFAVLGLMSAQLLNNMIRQHEIIDVRGERLIDLQRAMTIVQRDINQVVTRAVRDEYGDELGSFMTDGVFPIEFTRTGWRNPLEHRRSELQRVAFEHRDTTLYRYYWSVLDRAIDTEPVEQVLMENVLSVTFEPIDGYGDAYVPANAAGAPDDRQLQLAAVGVRFDIEGYGEINRLWEVPASLDRDPSGATLGGGPLDGDESDRVDEDQPDDNSRASDAEPDGENGTPSSRPSPPPDISADPPRADG